MVIATRPSSGKAGDKRIRVLIADDQPVFRMGLKSGLAPHRELEIVAEVGTGADAAAKARSAQADVIVLDIQTADGAGLETMGRFMQAAPQSRILVLTALNDVETVREHLCSGAWGYTLKSVGLHDIRSAIDMVMKGARVVSEGIPDAVFRDGTRARSGPKDSSILSEREKQVLKGLAEGRRNKELAQSLRLSVRTVEAHRLRITRKLGIRGFADLVRYAISAGIAKSL